VFVALVLPDLHLRKRFAQVGVILFVAYLLAPILTVSFVVLGGISTGALEIFYPTTILGISVLFIASLIPETSGETWGSMWPLVGYDNAVDGLYVRGPWLQRFQELDEMEAQNRMTTAMSDWF
jgi:hypothetical protein